MSEIFDERRLEWQFRDLGSCPQLPWKLEGIEVTVRHSFCPNSVQQILHFPVCSFSDDQIISNVIICWVTVILGFYNSSFHLSLFSFFLARQEAPPSSPSVQQPVPFWRGRPCPDTKIWTSQGFTWWNPWRFEYFHRFLHNFCCFLPELRTNKLGGLPQDLKCSNTLRISSNLDTIDACILIIGSLRHLANPWKRRETWQNFQGRRPCIQIGGAVCALTQLPWK